MSKRLSQLTAAASLTGSELVEVSKLSSTVTISATTISAQASDNSFNDSANGFVTAGFTTGKAVKVSGFTGSGANNIFSGVVTAVTAGKLTIGGTDGDVIVDDAAGESVTITQWDSKRSDAKTIAALVNTARPVYALTDGATIAMPADVSDSFRVTLAGNRTLLNPTGLYDGQVINIRIIQDGTGNRTLAYGSKYKFPGGAPVLSTAASAKDFLSCQYDALDDTLFCSLMKALS